MFLRRVLGFFFAAAWVCLSSACPGVTTDARNDLGKRDAGPNQDGATFIDMARNTTSCAGGGSVCSSANPGACDKGTVTCDGTLAMCTPDSTLQDCYEGIAGTQGVGICTAGQQSCIGVLGPCLGQILPAMQENCLNDLDDDCDGKVNNGCPDSIITGTPRVLTSAGMTGNAGQMSVDVRCPQDAFVIGADLWFYDTSFSATKIDLACAKATLTRPTSGTFYSLGVTPVSPSPYATFQAGSALATGSAVDGSCNAGPTSLRAIVKTRGKYDSGGFLGLFTQCGLASATLQADNTLAINLNTTGAEKGFVYNLAGTDVPYSTWTCASNEVVIGFKGKATTTSIDQLQPICAPLMTKYKP